MEKVIKQEYLSTIQERLTIYTFLKIGFEAPLSTGTLQHWKDHFTPGFIEILTADNDELLQFFCELKEKDLHEVHREQKEAYLATFDIFNEAGQIPAPPWESVYRTEDRTMFGEPVFHLRRQLENFELEFVNSKQEPEDHISVELEFMNFLIEYTGGALRNGDQVQFEKGIYTQYWLHKEHFSHWILPFTKDIRSSETSCLYKGLAKLLQSFVEEDFEYIKTFKEGLDKQQSRNI